MLVLASIIYFKHNHFVVFVVVFVDNERSWIRLVFDGCG